MTFKCKHTSDFLLFALVFIIHPALYSQQLFFHHLTKENGLINNRVTAIYQDKKGYMWIGTQTGLQRYDGTRFITYLADLHDSTALETD